MKKGIKGIYFLLQILLYFLIISFSCSLKDEYRTVISKSGLNLYSEPDNSKKIITQIPYKEKVKVLSKKSNTIKINGLNGVWTKIKWNTFEGWVFGAYIKKKSKINSNFYLYKLITYDEKKLKKIINKFYYNTAYSYNNFNNIKLYMFSELPNLIEDDEIFILTSKGVYSNRIKSLYISVDDFHGFMLNFNLKHQLTTNDKKIYIKKDFLLKKHCKKIKIKEIISQNKFQAHYFQYIIKNLHNSPVIISYNKELLNQINTILRTGFINKNFYIKKSKYSSKADIIYFETKKEKKYLELENFTSIFINNKIQYLMNSKFIMSFELCDYNYILLKEWKPDSGYGGYKLFQVNKNKLHLVKGDFSYSM